LTKNLLDRLVDRYMGCDESSVMLAHNEERKVVGIYRVKFKMFDRIVKASSTMTPVVELERNLISLGQLDSLGYGCL
jgi:hypothetical protein